VVEVISVVIFQWLVMAVVTTTLTEILKELFPWLHYQCKIAISGKEKMFYAERLIALLIAAGMSFAVSLDFFELFGISSCIPYLGWVVSFMIVSRGSSGIHDLWGQVKAAYTRFVDEFGAKLEDGEDG